MTWNTWGFLSGTNLRSHGERVDACKEEGGSAINDGRAGEAEEDDDREDGGCSETVVLFNALDSTDLTRVEWHGGCFLAGEMAAEDSSAMASCNEYEKPQAQKRYQSKQQWLTVNSREPMEGN